MIDRVPTYPGRVTLTPVSGQTNTYDLVRADEPTQAGTPLNKANLLTDTVANAIKVVAGESTAPTTPNEALNMLAAAIAAGVKMAFATYVGTGTYGQSNPTSLTFDFEPKLLYVAEESRLSLRGYAGLDDGTAFDKAFVALCGASDAKVYFNNGGMSVENFTWSNNTVSWYNTDSGERQLNKSGLTYTYFAIGA